MKDSGFFGLACILLATGLSGQRPGRAPGQRTASNLGFETGKAGAFPGGWFVPTPGYRAELSDEKAKAGRLCLRLSRTPAAGGRSFGNIMQSIDATRFRGRAVRLRAAVKVEQRMDHGQLWMRVDRGMGMIGFLGHSPLIRARDWAYFEVVANVAEDAARIAFGMMLRGKVAWLDDVTIEAGAPVGKPEPARELSERGLANLVSFSRLLGYVRHFHPSDEAAATDWDAFAVAGIRAVEGAGDAQQLASILGDLFRPVAPTVRVFLDGMEPEKARSWKGRDTKVLGWLHHGLGTGHGPSIYESKRVSTGPLADPDKPFRARLAGGVSCLVPLAVHADASGTLPRVSGAKQGARAVPAAFTGEDRATRLAAVALLWNVFQHFYPYFDVVETDWSRVLPESLEAAASDTDAAAFHRTLSRLVARLRDGHGSVSHHSVRRNKGLPLAFAWVENELVVTAVRKGGQRLDLERGDVVLAIDGRKAAEILAEIEERSSGASPGHRRYVATRVLPFELGVGRVVLTVKRGAAEPQEVAVIPELRGLLMPEKRPPKIQELEPGVWYVDIDRIDDEDFKAALPELEKARGVVFDLRGYPRRLSTIVLAHLIDEPIRCARWLVPIVRRPDREGMDFDFSDWPVKPQKPRLTGKIAFLVDARTMSYGETYMGMVEHYELAEIVGQTTAGTNGNVNPLALPGGYRVTWTGMKVLKHDGSQHHGIGIVPTLPVERTIAGIRAGRDEILEAGLRAVSR